MKHRILCLAAASTVAFAAALPVAAQQTYDRIHFLVPGGAGGGWDGAARGVGEALTAAGLVVNASFENMSGGGGGLAFTYLIDNAASNHGTLMVQSTPLIIRGLTGEISQTFRDAVPIAGVLGDYGALVVAQDSEIHTFQDFLDAYAANPDAVATGGGSVPGGMDHLVVSLILEAAGVNAEDVQYIPYDAGGTAMAGLLSGEVVALSTGFSEAVDMAAAGEVRILGLTALERLEEFPDVPTFAEQGAEMEFVNWRGFFAAPGLPEEEADAFVATLKAMMETPEWEAVRARNGWTNIWYAGDDFTEFLTNQEEEMREMMTDLGFL
ncbi:tripartite tricarboxylate transporter substrate-binding protein [Pararhodobacter sp. SW119]|uniref:tripartite tricarboxylate transporter substrate binding protein n=1 Tax=Pararhodobacter sp. SW119 TaxID=2780075 RepID=UPI001FD81514|nr:tripartite tricarboxylate transporter substrate-binding protein [Pararhodobacter sp. SW119]